MENLKEEQKQFIEAFEQDDDNFVGLLHKAHADKLLGKGPRKPNCEIRMMSNEVTPKSVDNIGSEIVIPTEPIMPNRVDEILMELTGNTKAAEFWGIKQPVSTSAPTVAPTSATASPKPTVEKCIVPATKNAVPAETANVYNITIHTMNVKHLHM